MSQNASSVSADQCGVFPALVDGLPAAKTSKDLRPGCPAQYPAPLVEPNSVYWTSVWSRDMNMIHTPIQIDFSALNIVEVYSKATFGNEHLKEAWVQHWTKLIYTTVFYVLLAGCNRDTLSLVNL